MGPIDRGALRAMAEKATPGPWKSFDDVETIDAVNHEARVCYTRDGVTCEWCLAIAGETDDAGAWTESTLARWRSDARYIAAVSPTVVLALLDALDAAERAAASLAQDAGVLASRALCFRDRAEKAERERDAGAMTKIDLDEAERLAKAASDGPWAVCAMALGERLAREGRDERIPELTILRDALAAEREAHAETLRIVAANAETLRNLHAVMTASGDAATRELDTLRATVERLERVLTEHGPRPITGEPEFAKCGACGRAWSVKHHGADGRDGGSLHAIGCVWVALRAALDAAKETPSHGGWCARRSRGSSRRTVGDG